MSNFFRTEIFDWLIGSVSLSHSVLFNWAFASILGTMLYVITYRMVGTLYGSDIISGSFMGKICYFILFIINAFFTALILRLIKVIIWIFDYASSLPIWICLLILGGAAVIIIFIWYKKYSRADVENEV